MMMASIVAPRQIWQVASLLRPIVRALSFDAGFLIHGEVTNLDSPFSWTPTHTTTSSIGTRRGILRDKNYVHKIGSQKQNTFCPPPRPLEIPGACAKQSTDHYSGRGNRTNKSCKRWRRLVHDRKTNLPLCRPPPTLIDVRSVSASLLRGLGRWGGGRVCVCGDFPSTRVVLSSRVWSQGQKGTDNIPANQKQEKILPNSHSFRVCTRLPIGFGLRVLNPRPEGE